MMASDFIIDVSEEDFEYQVLAYSQQFPVIVDFWAEWCAPCRVLGPLLERLAIEAGGTFRLAKVNVDQNQKLAGRYQVRSIPAVKAFRDGRVISEFLGAQPEPRVREFLRAIAPSQSDLAVSKGLSLLGSSQPKEAELSFREALSITPDLPPALLGLGKSLLLQDKISEAKDLFKDFPASREYNSVEILTPLTDTLLNFPDQPANFDDPLAAAYSNSLRLFRRGYLEACLDGILDLLRQNKAYRNGEARRVFLAILELIGDESPIARQYRSELASVLF